MIDVLVGFGCLIMAYGFLGASTLVKSSAARISLIVVGFIFLILQGLVCIVLNNFNRAFGAGSSESWISISSIIGAIGFVSLAIFLIYKNRDRKKKDKVINQAV